MQKIVSVSSLTSGLIQENNGVVVKRERGSVVNFLMVRKAFGGYEVVTPRSFQRLAKYSDIKSVQSFIRAV